MIYYLAYHNSGKWGVVKVDTMSTHYRKFTKHSIEWYCTLYCDDLKFRSENDAWNYIKRKTIINTILRR